ncbi:hypothetical protein HPP92_024953 [Vanilla planifolia]|uniref:noroxomaritidine synthase n=1 Tax=Vanilla planifolia TaxID=51239 RepID=A0A835PKM3_VANPL|nr:hypothetical protein HPP92_024953 [Vanilla planifolia]
MDSIFKVGSSMELETLSGIDEFGMREGYLCKHLSWFFCMLCKNPLVQEKIVAEIQWLVGPQTTPFNIDAFLVRLREKELDRMQYLHAALTETLRLKSYEHLYHKYLLEHFNGNYQYNKKNYL